MLLQHLHMASDIFLVLHKTNTKKGNRRIKPCLKKQGIYLRLKTLNTVISRNQLGWGTDDLPDERDQVWHLTGISCSGFFCCDNKCIHPTQQISIFTLQAFNRVTCCDEHKLFWAQFPPPPSPTLLTAAVVFVTVCVKTNMSHSAYEAAPLTPRHRMHATKIQSRNIQRQSESVLGVHCYSLSPDNEATFGQDWLWLMHDFTVLLATDLQLITNN